MKLSHFQFPLFMALLFLSVHWFPSKMGSVQWRDLNTQFENLAPHIQTIKNGGKKKNSYANIRVILGAVEMYGMDRPARVLKEEMKRIEIKEKKNSPNEPETGAK